MARLDSEVSLHTTMNSGIDGDPLSSHACGDVTANLSDDSLHLDSVFLLIVADLEFIHLLFIDLLLDLAFSDLAEIESESLSEGLLSEDLVMVHNYIKVDDGKSEASACGGFVGDAIVAIGVTVGGVVAAIVVTPDYNLSVCERGAAVNYLALGRSSRNDLVNVFPARSVRTSHIIAALDIT